jgi:hypothetical protein
MARISTIFLGLIVFCAMIFAFGAQINDMQQNYNMTIDSAYTKTYQKINQTTALAIAIQGNMTGQAITTTGFIETIGEGAYKLLRLVMQLIPMVNAIIQDTLSVATDTIGLPQWIGQIIMLMFAITIIFLIIAAVLRDFSRSV